MKSIFASIRLLSFMFNELLPHYLIHVCHMMVLVCLFSVRLPNEQPFVASLESKTAQVAT